MAQLLVRDLAPEILEGLKERARRHGRSLQSEAKIILEGAVAFSGTEAREIAQKWQRRLAGRSLGDSADLIREDRGR